MHPLLLFRFPSSSRRRPNVCWCSHQLCIVSLFCIWIHSFLNQQLLSLTSLVSSTTPPTSLLSSTICSPLQFSLLLSHHSPHSASSSPTPIVSPSPHPFPPPSSSPPTLPASKWKLICERSNLPAEHATNFLLILALHQRTLEPFSTVKVWVLEPGTTLTAVGTPHKGVPRNGTALETEMSVSRSDSCIIASS